MGAYVHLALWFALVWLLELLGMAKCWGNYNAMLFAHDPRDDLDDATKAQQQEATSARHVATSVSTEGSILT